MINTIACDLGGTSVRFARCERVNGVLELSDKKSYTTADFQSFEDALRKYCTDVSCSPRSLCIGVPGPVAQGAVQLTNVPWQFSEQSLQDALSLPSVRIVNDLFALASSLPDLSEDGDLVTLHNGKLTAPEWSSSFTYKYCILAPGTGLGHASALRKGDEWTVLPSEGGHIDFAPRTDRCIELLRFLRTRYQRVSYERILCGPGLQNIYEFLGTLPEFSGDKISTNQEIPLPEEISQAGLEGTSPRCIETLDIFALSLGALCGNFVLHNLSTGGVYLGGGLSAKLLPFLSESRFTEFYLQQGRLSRIVEQTPVFVISQQDAGLVGAARIALQNLKIGETSQ